MIRPGQFSDLPAIRLLEQSSATTAHWGDAVYRAIVEGKDQRRILLVAQQDLAPSENEALVTGFAVASSAGLEWELENIVVAQAFQGQGVGAQLLGAIVERACATGAVEIHAEVRESNPALSGFYKRLGFNEIGRRAKYYSNPPEDAVLIRLLINRP